MAQTKYLHIDFFDKYFKELKRKKADFVLSKTTYSRKIVVGGVTTIFNQDGGNDHKVLSLINNVRQNAKEYLSNTSYEKRETYIHFFDLFKRPKSDEVIWKIDIRSAYWSSALKRGIIKQETNDKLTKSYEGKPAKEMKQARLKALGSLATNKMVQTYIEGKLEFEEQIPEITKELYMDICRDVDNIMRECVDENQTVIYYYWDCIFVPKNTSKGVLDFFKKRDYNVSVEETKLLYIDIFKDGGGYLLSEMDSKAYMVRGVWFNRQYLET